jgi:hypothetical protein
MLLGPSAESPKYETVEGIPEASGLREITTSLAEHNSDSPL